MTCPCWSSASRLNGHEGLQSLFEISSWIIRVLWARSHRSEPSMTLPREKSQRESLKQTSVNTEIDTDVSLR